MRTAIERRLSDYDVTAQQWAAMKLIHDEEACSLVSVAAGLGVDLGATSRLISRLEEKGFLARRPSSADRRSIRLVLTVEGRHLIPKRSRTAEQVNRAFETRITAEEHRLLTRILGKMLEERTKARGALTNVPEELPSG